MRSTDALFYDTFRSWPDGLPEDGDTIRLFSGHGAEHLGEPVTNLSRNGMLSRDQSYNIRQIGARLTANSRETVQRAVENMAVHLDVSARPAYEFPLTILGAQAESCSNELSEKMADPGRGEGHAVFVRLEPPIDLLAGQSFSVVVGFGALSRELRATFHERGPAARWLQLIVYLSGQLIRSAI